MRCSAVQCSPSVRMIVQNSTNQIQLNSVQLLLSTVSTYSTIRVYSVWCILSTFNMYSAVPRMRTYVPSCWEGRLGRRVALRRWVAHRFHHWALPAVNKFKLNNNEVTKQKQVMIMLSVDSEQLGIVREKRKKRELRKKRKLGNIY